MDSWWEGGWRNKASQSSPTRGSTVDGSQPSVDEAPHLPLQHTLIKGQLTPAYVSPSVHNRARAVGYYSYHTPIGLLPHNYRTSAMLLRDYHRRHD